MPDQVEGLTSSEIDLLRGSWIPFGEDLQESGITFFLAYFKRHAVYQEAFPFRGIPLNELRQNESFRRHAKAVFKFLDTAIASLDNTPEVIRMLENNGKSHAYKKVALNWSHYEHLENTLMDVVCQHYDQDKRPLGSLEKETWAKFLGFVSSNIHQAVQKYQTSPQR